jgi:transcriptional regulator with XRE-family HTH domain
MQMMIGSELRRQREARGWSQELLAREAGVALRTVARLESGTTAKGRKETRRRIAEALGVDCPSSPNGTGEDGSTSK